MDPMILIGSDLINERALPEKWSKIQLIDLDRSPIKISKTETSHVYIISILCSFYKSSQF